MTSHQEPVGGASVRGRGQPGLPAGGELPRPGHGDTAGQAGQLRDTE